MKIDGNKTRGEERNGHERKAKEKREGGRKKTEKWEVQDVKHSGQRFVDRDRGEEDRGGGWDERLS